MIVSDASRFVFFHNPKAGGASAHKTLAPFHDIGLGLHGLDAAKTRWLSHLSVDEFAGLYPQLWEKARDWRKFGLFRAPYERFISGVFQYSKSHSETEIRFLPAARRRDFLLKLIAELERAGSAEAVMDRVDYTFFRPQWVFLRSGDGEVRVEAYPLEEAARFYAALSAHVGTPLAPERINAREQIALPGPLGRVMASGRRARALRRLPGAGGVKRWLGRRFGEDKAVSPFGLDTREEADLRAFVDRFFARDLNELPAIRARMAGEPVT